MTGYESKRAAAQDKLDDDDTQVYQDHDDALTIAYQSGYYDGKKAAQPAQEPAIGDIRALKHRIHELEGEVIGYKQILDAQPAQEPVAYLCKPDQHGLFDIPTPDKACKDCFPVYTTPPQRTWVGLTREEFEQCYESMGEPMDDWALGRAIEAKLKEKNT